MRRKIWVRTPAAGGRDILAVARQQIEARLRGYAERFFRGKYTRLDIRFHGKFCYIDAYTEPAAPRRLPSGWSETRAQYLERLRSTPTHLCRLRYFDVDRWSFALYTYSHERYEVTCFPSGEFWGPPEEALHAAARLYLS